MAKPGKRKPAPAIKKKPGMTLAQKMGGPATKAARPQAGQRQQKGGGGGARHTILLKQAKDKASRTWSSHNAPVEARRAHRRPPMRGIERRSALTRVSLAPVVLRRSMRW